jgi:hypothetical protein
MTFIKIKQTDENSSFKIFIKSMAPVSLYYSWLATNHEMWNTS